MRLGRRAAAETRHLETSGDLLSKSPLRCTRARQGGPSDGVVGYGCKSAGVGFFFLFEKETLLLAWKLAALARGLVSLSIFASGASQGLSLVRRTPRPPRFRNGARGEEIRSCLWTAGGGGEGGVSGLRLTQTRTATDRLVGHWSVLAGVRGGPGAASLLGRRTRELDVDRHLGLDLRPVTGRLCPYLPC